jgi:hypothetical protein
MQHSSSSTQQRAIPRSLINLEAARQRFGAQKVDLLIDLMYTGDALADAVLAELDAAGPQAGRQLARAISQGLASLEEPTPAIRAFFEQVERLPDWVDMERLQRGSAYTLSIGSLWLIFSLGPGSLTHTYSSPSIARVLVRTGNLTRMAGRRLMETGAWHIASVMPGGLLRGADGYVHNLQVRFLHARVRATLLKRGWDEQEAGLPVNQVEMTRTWLDFTYVPFRALQQFGITFTREELADLYHFWHYVAFLLGIDERLYRQIIDQESAQEVLELIDQTTEGANEDSKALVQAMLEAITELLTLKLPTAVKFDLVSALTRRLHGDQLADQLGIKRNWLRLLMPLITLANRVQRAWDRRSPAARQRAIERTIKAFENIAPLEGDTAYQRNASNPTQQQLPQTISALKEK